MPERGAQLTFNGVDVGPKVSARDAEVICRWLSKAHKSIAAYYRRAMMARLPGWQCMCACHRLRQATKHCIGCAEVKVREQIMSDGDLVQDQGPYREISVKALAELRALRLRIEAGGSRRMFTMYPEEAEIVSNKAFDTFDAPLV